MSSPLLGAIGIGSTIAGGMLSAEGAAQQGEAQMQQNVYQYGVAMLNQQIAKQNADFAINAGEVSARDTGLAGGQRIANIETAQASSGIDVNSGSAAAVRAGQKTVINMDVDQIRSDAAKTAYNYDVQATQFEAQGQEYLKAGANAVQAAAINETSSFLSTTASVASKWSQASQSGMFNIGGMGDSSGSTA